MDVLYPLGTAISRGQAALAVSAFDGGDRAHRRLAQHTADLAARQSARSVGVVLWPGVGPGERVVATLDERLALLGASVSFDEVAVLPTDAPGSGDTRALLDTLGDWYDVRAIVAERSAPEVGGHVPPWEATRLGAACQERGWAFALTESGAEDEEAQPSGIIVTVARGDVEQAARMLGHPFLVSGHVIEGDKRGRLLGFPTANLRPDARKALPANGVYAVRVRLPGEEAATHPAVTNIGVRPTFGAGQTPLIETHLLDATLDLYGVPIAVEFVARLRAEQRFESIDALKAQMARDAQRARTLLAVN
ncbi:MAG: hypothetical protein IVW57_03110 [Ktedonobacterales bacterium]|nr:hypothetical protein [Ktedonobacterales bacterium]